MTVYKKGVAVKVAENFNSTEFDCNGVDCCNETKISPRLVEILQNIRDHFGNQVIINSAFRCDEHNKNVGGVENSRHTKGDAADIVVKNVAPLDVAKYCEKIGVKGIGLYDWGCHVDTREEKSFWYSDNQEYRATFGGAEPKIEVMEWQSAAIRDGFKFAIYGADGKWGKESESVAKKAICKKRTTYKYKNLTKLVQRVVGVAEDGKFGNDTESAVKIWQSEVGLNADGIIGINSWKKMLGV